MDVMDNQKSDRGVQERDCMTRVEKAIEQKQGFLESLIQQRSSQSCGSRAFADRSNHNGHHSRRQNSRRKSLDMQAATNSNSRTHTGRDSYASKVKSTLAVDHRFGPLFQPSPYPEITVLTDVMSRKAGHSRYTEVEIITMVILMLLQLYIYQN